MHHPYQNGLTVIEILVVFSIFAFLATLGLPSYNLLRQELILNNQTKEIVGALQVAQNLAISAQGGQDHRVALQTSEYQVDNDTPNTINNGLQITQGNGKEIIFDKLAGTASICQTPSCTTPTACTASSCQIKVSASGKERVIEIDAIGKISIN